MVGIFQRCRRCWPSWRLSAGTGSTSPSCTQATSTLFGSRRPGSCSPTFLVNFEPSDRRWSGDDERMKVVFRWHLCEEDLVLDLPFLPDEDHSVVLTFAIGPEEHPFRVRWVRWYPMVDPPYALVQVTQR